MKSKGFSGPDIKLLKKIHKEGMAAIFALTAFLPAKKRDQIIDASSKLASAFDMALTRSHFLESEVKTDPLTGFANRAGLMANLDSIIINMQRYKDKRVAAVYIDLDGFSEVNNNLGHDVGDEALIAVTNAINSVFRDSDILSRPGGDEIVMLLPYEGGEVFCPDTVKNKIREAIKPIVYSKDEAIYPIGASIGTSVLNSNDLEKGLTEKERQGFAKDLLKRADQEMYKDKIHKHDRLAERKQEIHAAQGKQSAPAAAAP